MERATQTTSRFLGSRFYAPGRIVVHDLRQPSVRIPSRRITQRGGSSSPGPSDRWAVSAVVQTGAVRYRIDGIELDEDARTLTGRDGPVHVEPQVFDVLAHLVANRERAVAKSELLDEIWGDQFVSESALTSRIKSARAALGDNGREQRHIRTAQGFGYQFVSEVETLGPRVMTDDARTGDRSAGSLPQYQTTLYGRDEERDEVA